MSTALSKITRSLFHAKARAADAEALVAHSEARLVRHTAEVLALTKATEPPTEKHVLELAQKMLDFSILAHARAVEERKNARARAEFLAAAVAASVSDATSNTTNNTTGSTATANTTTTTANADYGAPCQPQFLVATLFYVAILRRFVFHCCVISL